MTSLGESRERSWRCNIHTRKLARRAQILHRFRKQRMESPIGWIWRRYKWDTMIIALKLERWDFHFLTSGSPQKSSYGRGICLQFFILFRGLRCPFSVQVENGSSFFPFEIGFPLLLSILQTNDGFASDSE